MADPGGAALQCGRLDTKYSRAHDHKGGDTDAARLHAASARLHVGANRPARAWQAARVADRLVGARPSFEQYALEAHAGVAEVCLALLEQAGDAADPRRATRDGRRRLRRYARTFPMARPRALICLGWHAWLAGHAGTARRTWARAVREGDRLPRRALPR